MVKEWKYCIRVIRKYFNKKLVMTKEDDGDFESSTNCWICDNPHVDGDIKVRDHWYITEKYRVSGQINCNINVKINKKIPIAFCSLLPSCYTRTR